MLVGGYAVALYGYVRPTKDMDVWISTSPENVDRLVQALVKFGFTAGVKKEQFGGPQTVFRMGVPPNCLEIITSVSGIQFVDCYPRRKTVEVDGVSVSLIDFADLKRNKTASGRLSDLADIERLEKARKTDGN
jgi:hypothetical protein